MDLSLVSFTIEGLQFYLTEMNFDNMRQYFTIESNEDVEALRENFMINVESLIKALKAYEKNQLNN